MAVAAAPPEVAPANPLASAHKVLLWLLIAYIGAVVFWPVLVILIPFQIVAQWRVNRLLGWSPAATGTAIVGTLVPYVGIISLLTSEQSARSRIKEQGVEVGFWGAVSDSTEVSVLSVVMVIALWVWCLVLLTALAYVAWEYFAGRVPNELFKLAFWWVAILATSLEFAGHQSLLLYRRIKESRRP